MVLRSSDVNIFLPKVIYVSLLSLSIGLVVGEQPRRVRIEDHCGQTLPLETSALPMVLDWASLPANGSSCEVGFQSFSSCHQSAKTHVQLSILNLDIPVDGSGHKRCDNHSRVDMVECDGKTIISNPNGLCGLLSDGQYTCETDVIYLRVTSTNSTLGGKLLVLATAFNNLVCDTAEEFGCDNHRCIAKGLACNGYNDCGDNSDEKDGCWLTTEFIAIVAVASLVLVAVVVVTSIFAYRRRMRWGAGPIPTIDRPSLNDERRPLLK